MLTSGLVSLNVHEALAYDGTEICLHPDLFLPGGTPSDLGSTIPQSLSMNNNVKDMRNSLKSPASHDGIDPPPPNDKILKVGDIIEIRVWDPHPRVGATNAGSVNKGVGKTIANAASIIRKRANNSLPTNAAFQSSASQSSQTSVSESNQVAVEQIQQSTVSTESVEAAGLASEPPQDLANQSLQYSDSARSRPVNDNASSASPTRTADGSSVSSKDTTAVHRSSHDIAQSNSASASILFKDVEINPSSSNIGDLSSVDPEDSGEPPTKTVSTPGGMPPVFPRARTNTTDSGRALPATKPPMHSRNNSLSEPTTANTTKIRGANSTGNALNKPPSISGHVRDISDMTIETVYDADGRGRTAVSPAYGDLQVQPVNSNVTGSEDEFYGDDVEDDVWSFFSASHTLRLSFVMLVTENSLTSMKANSRAQVSILRKVADLYDLSSYDTVTIGKIDKRDEPLVMAAVSADFVVVTIKDQFISRGDMLMFQESLMGTWIYTGERLTEPTRSIQAHAQEIRHGDHQARSGIVTDKTTITFRSRSARFMWLVQMSAEMWDYASPFERNHGTSRCEIYFDKLVTFLHNLFAKWKKLETTHSLTVVFFSRTFLGSGHGLFVPGEVQSRVQRDIYGRLYEDHFRMIIENEVSSDWETLVVRFKESFVQYPIEMGWNLETGDESRRPSLASQGNVLEAINVTLNLMQYHYLDRDLHRTGNSLVVMSAGSGVFEVDKGLAGITYQRMMDNGIGSDVVSLGLPPLHISPFFLYVNLYQQVGTEGVDATETYYEVPHWMNLSFVSYDDEGELSSDKNTDDPIVQKPRLQSPGGFTVAPNGFILPRAKNQVEEENTASPLLRPKTFSPHGNAASSPKKQTQLTQERQLIAGRDFRDILEACRPRDHILPSALKAFISMYEHSSKTPNRDDEASVDSPEPIEWGAIDSRAALPVSGDSGSSRLRSFSLGQESDPSPLVAFSPPRVDELDAVDSTSQSSSITSQISGYLLGVSFERPFVSQQSQMQRCPSLEFETLGRNLRSPTASPLLSPEADGGFESEEEAQGFMRRVRQLMKAHDHEICTSILPSPKFAPQSDGMQTGDPNNSRQGAKPLALIPPQASMSQQRLSSGTGGIGAALSNFRTSSGGSRLLRGDVEVDGKSIQRISSSTGIAGLHRGFRQFSEMAPRGMSPLFLPPVTSVTDPGETLGWGSLDPRLAPRARDVHVQVGSAGPLSTKASSKVDPGHEIKNPPAGALFSSSPPAGTRFGSIRKDRVTQLSISREPSGRNKSSHGSRRKKAFNPFRQKDEDEVLAKNSHNRRRWSHVFALGEVEFRRRTGPNWKSLTAPAILPLYVGYFPTQSEVDHGFTFSINNITLKEFDRTYYSSNKDLLMEMVRQRLTQDFQVVPPSHVNASNLRRETLRDGLANRGRSASTRTKENPDLIRQFLSMGHRLQTLTYDPESDIIEVTRYDAIKARGSSSDTVKYYYMCYCEETKQYNRVVQTFKKYNSPYNWSKFDRIICGDEDREMREGMRFRRIMFGLIPPDFKGNIGAEQEYIAKFLRLLDYFNRLRDKEEDSDSSALSVKIVSNSDDSPPDRPSGFSSTPGISRNSMQRFYVELRKRKRDPIEWMEVVIDSTFNTKWSYRIMLHWLVASSAKVDNQVQLLQRRCTRFGLELKPFPQSTVSRNAFLNPIKVPHFFVIRDKAASDKLNRELANLDFLHDGVFSTDIKSVLECIEPMDFDAEGSRWKSAVNGSQLVHRSGTLFVRLISDKKGRTIIIVKGNYLYTKREARFEAIAKQVFKELSQCIDRVQKDS